MANNERSFQTDLIRDIKSRPAHVFKAMMAVMGGVPDIYVRDATFGAMWIELKFERAPIRESTRIPVKLTPLQRSFIRKEQTVGGVAGWCICIKRSDGSELVYAGADPDTESLSLKSSWGYVGTKKRGDQYNVIGIYRQILAGSNPLQNPDEPRVETDEA